MIVSATNELRFHQWPHEGDDEQYSINTTAASITSLSWSKDNNFLIYVQGDGRPEILSLKDLSNIKPIHVITAIDNASAAIFQRNTKRWVAIGTKNATTALYDTKTKTIAKIFTLSAPVVSLDFNANDELLVVTCTTGHISVFNVVDETESTCYCIDEHPSVVRFHHSDIYMFAVGTENGSLHVFDVQLPDALFTNKCHSSRVNGLVFCIKKNDILTVGDNRFCIHNIALKDCTYRGHLQYPLTSVDISPDGKHVAIGTATGHIILYETKTFLSPYLTLKPYDTLVSCIKFSNKTYAESTISDNSIEAEQPAEGPSRLREEHEFRSLYKEFLSKSEEDSIHWLKEDLLADLEKDANELQIQMEVHMSSLQEFIRKEFDKMSSEMDDKWDLLNLVSGTYRSSDILNPDEECMTTF